LTPLFFFFLVSPGSWLSNLTLYEGGVAQLRVLGPCCAPSAPDGRHWAMQQRGSSQPREPAQFAMPSRDLVAEDPRDSSGRGAGRNERLPASRRIRVRDEIGPLDGKGLRYVIWLARHLLGHLQTQWWSLSLLLAIARPSIASISILYPSPRPVNCEPPPEDIGGHPQSLRGTFSSFLP
jgi:hypothetical protein